MRDSVIQYETLKRERKRFLIYEYMALNPSDIENMVTTLHNVFQSIKDTSFDVRTQQNYRGDGITELIEESDQELKKLERSLKLNVLQQDDLRYTLFKMIKEML